MGQCVFGIFSEKSTRKRLITLIAAWHTEKQQLMSCNCTLRSIASDGVRPFQEASMLIYITSKQLCQLHKHTRSADGAARARTVCAFLTAVRCIETTLEQNCATQQHHQQDAESHLRIANNDDTASAIISICPNTHT